MSFSKTRSGRVHPDEQIEGPQLIRAPSLRSQKSLVRRASAVAAAAAAEAEERAKGLLLPEPEYTEWLAHKVRHGGRQAAMAFLRVYLRMLVIIFCVAVYMFGMFALMSWAVPNKLCNRIAKENSGAAFGILECIYNDTNNEGGYGVRWGAKLFWTVFWSLQMGWQAFFPSVLAYVLCGPAFTTRNTVIAIILGLLNCAICPIAGPGFGLAFSNFGIVFGSLIAMNLAVFQSGHVVRRYTGSALTGSRWVMSFFLVIVQGAIYEFFIPMMVTARAGEAMGGLALTFFRVIVHPFLWSLLSLNFRFVMRHIGYVAGNAGLLYIMFPIIYSSIYGRFLLLQLDGVGSVIVMNLLFECFDLAGRLGDRASDGLLLKLLYGERARDALTARREQDDTRTMEVFASMMLEISSIFSASAIFSLGGVATASGVPTDHYAIWTNALAQFLTTVVFGFLGLVIEGKYHEFDWDKSFRPSKKVMLWFIPAIALGATKLCVLMIALFCPVYYPEHDRILLEACDKPSLFQAITFSGAQRFKMMGSYFNITTPGMLNG